MQTRNDEYNAHDNTAYQLKLYWVQDVTVPSSTFLALPTQL